MPCDKPGPISVAAAIGPSRRTALQPTHHDIGERANRGSYVLRQIIKGCFLMVGEAGVPAAEVSGGAAHPDPKLNCVLVADVAPGQSLGVQYANYAATTPGSTTKVACQLDRTAAELIVSNLRTLAH